MELLKQPPTGKGSADWFAGDVWFDVIYRGEEPSRARAWMVKFAPGARTHWHSHGGGQTLYIVEGVALIQSRGGEIIEAHPGDIVYTPPGEEHWHGAAPDHFMIHLALWENPGPDGAPELTVLEHVPDDQYNGPRHSTRACEARLLDLAWTAGGPGSSLSDLLGPSTCLCAVCWVARRCWLGVRCPRCPNSLCCSTRTWCCAARTEP